MEEVNGEEKLGSKSWDNLLPYSTNWTMMMKFAKGTHRTKKKKQVYTDLKKILRMEMT
jgi:hypothetical protein